MNARTVSGWIRANVLGFVAIFIALSGTAVASLPGTDTVDSGDIINGEVRNPDIRDAAVTSDKIGLGQVDTPQLHGDAVTGTKVADGSLGAADVAPDSLGGGQIDEASLASSVLQRRLASGCASGSAIRDVDAAGNVTCEPTTGGSGGGPPTGPAGGDLAGNYPNPDIAANAVGANEIAAGGVGSSEISDGAVGNADLAANAVSGTKVQDGTLSGADISNDSVGANSIANTNSLGAPEINEADLNIAVGKTAHDNSSCFGSNDGGTCASMTLTLPRAEHVLLIASGEWVTFEFNDQQQPSDPGNSAQADCHLEADDTLVGSDVNFGEKQASFGATPVHDSFFPGNFVVTAITGTLSGGSHTLKLNCFDDDGHIEVVDSRITALAID